MDELSTQGNKICNKPCSGCTHKCLTNHPSSTSNEFSFFKLMLRNFSSFLEIPSECAQRLQNQACKDVILEGPSGHLWHVELSCTSTSTCFKDGWDKFVSDNSIETEDIIVFRHAMNMHFVVQIFGSDGFKKQSTFTAENYGLCPSKKGNPLTICTWRRHEHGEKTIEAYTHCENSFNLKQKRNKSTGVEGLTTNLKQTFSKCDIKEIETVPVTTILRKRKKVQTVLASDAETCISDDKPVLLNNQLLHSPSKTNVMNARRIERAKFHILGKAVSLCTEQPIILDAEENIDTQVSSAYNHDQAEVEACDHLALDVQEKPSWRVPNVSPMEGGKFSLIPFADVSKLKQGKKLVMTGPKFSLVMTRTSVYTRYRVSFPVDFGRNWLRQKEAEVLLLGQSGEWTATFKWKGRFCGIDGGWKEFVMDNKIEVGDICAFEFVNRVNHTFKVDIFREQKYGDPSARKIATLRANVLDAHDKNPNSEVSSSIP